MLDSQTIYETTPSNIDLLAQIANELQSVRSNETIIRFNGFTCDSNTISVKFTRKYSKNPPTYVIEADIFCTDRALYNHFYASELKKLIYFGKKGTSERGSAIGNTVKNLNDYRPPDEQILAYMRSALQIAISERDAAIAARLKAESQLSEARQLIATLNAEMAVSSTPKTLFVAASQASKEITTPTARPSEPLLHGEELKRFETHLRANPWIPYSGITACDHIRTVCAEWLGHGLTRKHIYDVQKNLANKYSMEIYHDKSLRIEGITIMKNESEFSHLSPEEQLKAKLEKHNKQRRDKRAERRVARSTGHPEPKP